MELTIAGGRLQHLKILGIEITRKALPSSLASVDNRGGWWPIIRESFAGAWQQNITVDTTTVLSFSALYACVTLIASDIAKMRIKLVRRNQYGLWEETDNPAYSPVLRKPNHFQTRIQFMENWVASKLIHGNAYILKGRDNRRVVRAMYVLDPTRCRPLVAPNGDVYYELKRDDLAGDIFDDLIVQGESQIIVPASEVIHDVMTPMFHPLVGVSPIRACGLAALQGLRIQENSTHFFQNGAAPGVVLSAPGVIKQDTADRIKSYWETEFSGENVGKVAVLGDGLKIEKFSVDAVDAQLIEQLKWTAENVCTAFRVPPYKVNVGPSPSYNNIEALDQQYYSQTLQSPIESIELLLDEGLALTRDGEPQELGVEFDLPGLMRMDTSSRVKAAADAIAGSGMSPNEARLEFLDKPPVKGGDTPYMQQQNFSLAALAERDQDKPFAKPTPAPAAPSPTDDDMDDDEPAEDVERAVADLFRMELGLVTT